jgi:hypothetical protein
MEQVAIDHENEIQALQLGLNVEASMLPETAKLEFWERRVHEQMYELNPRLMDLLFKSNRLRQYLSDQQELMSGAARALEAAYRKENPLSLEASHLERTGWLNQAKSFARETLLTELSVKMSSLTLEQSEQPLHS